MSVEPLHSTPHCVLCTEPLQRGQRKCTKCGAFQDRECTSCGTMLPPNAVRCGTCKKVQQGTPCVACGALLEQGMKRCPDCSTWQTRKRFIPASQLTLALILSIISLLSAVVPPVVRYFQNRSRTYVRIIGDSEYKAKATDVPETTIRVLVVNNGKRPSMVKSALITFENVKAKPAELQVRNLDSALIVPEKHEYIHLSAETVMRESGVTKQQILDSLANGKARIALRVEETDRDGEFYDADPAPEHVINASEIDEWMASHVSSSNQ